MTTKMLFHSNSPWSPTGYGNQCGLFAPELAQHYDLAISSFYGLEGSPIRWGGIPVLPGIGGDYGSESLLAHAERFFGGNLRGGLVVTLMDVWVLDVQKLGQLNCACWVPVDHDPAPPRVVDFFRNSGAVPIAMSRFGEERLAEFDPLYVPHAVDTTVYKPLGKGVRGQSFPDGAFVVGMVAANKGRPSRKGFVQAFQAFKRFADTHDNAFLYLHTLLDPNLAQGENIPALLRELDIPMDRVRIADQYTMLYEPYAHADMAKIYSALDVLLNPSLGEGFGIPVLEAAACGVPSIVTDFSAMPEVCGAGWHVKPASRYWTGLGSWQAVPDIDDIVNALEECYGLSGPDREQLSDTARKHALRYSLPLVLKTHMLPALREAEVRFEARFSKKPVEMKVRKRAAA